MIVPSRRARNHSLLIPIQIVALFISIFIFIFIFFPVFVFFSSSQTYHSFSMSRSRLLIMLQFSVFVSSLLLIASLHILVNLPTPYNNHHHDHQSPLSFFNYAKTTTVITITTDATNHCGASKVHCPTGTFPCASCPEICVEQWRNCDNSFDCPDKSDESSCRKLNPLHLISSILICSQ